MFLRAKKCARLAHTIGVPQKKVKYNPYLHGGAWLLTAAALLGKLLGAVYRIPLTRILGARGMGLYQSVFPTYVLLVTITGGGLTAAISKLVAESDGEFPLHAAVGYTLCFSLPVTLIAALLSRVIASAAGAPAAVWAFLALLPGVPVSAVCAVLRGRFQGMGNMRPSAWGQLIEQTVKLIAGLGAAYALSRVSLAASVVGCAAGVTAGEIAALMFYRLFARGKTEPAPATNSAAATEKAGAVDEMFYGIETLTEASAELAPPTAEQNAETPFAVRKDKKKTNGEAAKIFRMAFPITLGLLILPLCQVADSFVIVNLLVRYGASHEVATSLYGLVTGPVNALVNMPAVFTVGLCSMLLPKVSRMLRKGESIADTVKKTLLFSVAAGVVFVAGLALFAPLAVKILYGKSLGQPQHTVSTLVRLASVSVLFVVLMQTSAAVLQGGGRSYVPALNLAIAAIIKETLNFVLLPRMGIYGFVVATDIFYAVACLLDVAALSGFLLGLRKKKE